MSEVQSISLDETMFVIGSAPSLNKIDVSLLKGLNTISLNRQYIAYESWGFFPKYYAIIDQKLIKSIYQTDLFPQLINNSKCTIERYFFVQAKDEAIFDISEEHEHKITILRTYDSRLSNEELKKINLKSAFEKHAKNEEPLIPRGYYGNSGAFVTALSYALGYKRAVLLGIDASYPGRKKSIELGFDIEHFHPEYFDPKKFVEKTDYGRFNADSETKLWDDMTTGICNDPDFEIISCTPDSAINDFFDYIEIKELLNSYSSFSTKDDISQEDQSLDEY